MKSAYLLVIALVVVLVAALGYWNMSGMAVNPPSGDSDCGYSQLNYYFRESCSHCQQVARERSLEKLEGLGVKVDKREVVNWGMWGIYETPTFEFGGQRVAGYQSFEGLKGLLKCKA